MNKVKFKINRNYKDMPCLPLKINRLLNLNKLNSLVKANSYQLFFIMVFLTAKL